MPGAIEPAFVSSKRVSATVVLGTEGSQAGPSDIRGYDPWEWQLYQHHRFMVQQLQLQQQQLLLASSELKARTLGMTGNFTDSDHEVASTSIQYTFAASGLLEVAGAA